MCNKGNGADEEQSADNDFCEHGGFCLTHAGSTLALVGLCLALVSFASLFEFRLLLFSTIGTMLTNITARFRDMIASLVCVKLPTTVYAMNNVLFHGMSNSLLFFGHADL